MTRSCIRLAHGDLTGSWHFHPFGALVMLGAAASLAALLAGNSRRERVILGLQARPWVANLCGILLAAAFVIYGVGRAIWVLQSGQPSPW